MLETFVNYMLQITADLGYFGIFFLMTIESSFIPFPSEVVIPPAAFLAQKGEMNIYLVILFGILGSLLGALINYYLAMWLGKPLIYKFAGSKFSRFFLINDRKIEKAEEYFLKYGNISTFIGRLIPMIRQLISIPAGFVRMPLIPFLFYTFLGAGIWITLLAFQGYLIGVYKDLILQYLNWIAFGLGVGILVIYLIVRWVKKRRKEII